MYNNAYLRFMRIIISLLLALISFGSFSQKEINLKRKYIGNYKGIIPSYSMDTGNEVVQVSSTNIFIEITKDSVFVKIGISTGSMTSDSTHFDKLSGVSSMTNSLKGDYYIMFEAKTYYLLEATIEGQLATERILVYKRKKHISRDGMYPQPVAELKKFKVK